MEITFASRKLESALASDKSRVRTFGSEMAHRLARRMAQLHAAPNLEEMRSLPGRCHELREDRDGQLAVDVTKNYRLIFRPIADPPSAKSDGGLDWSRVAAIIILEVGDYHGD